MIHGEKFTEYLALYLFDKIVYGVSVNKTSFFGIMGM